MSYPSHIKMKAPEINLPYPRCTKQIIYEYFCITGEESTPRKVAICKICKSEIRMIQGSNVYSSYTFGLTSHLQKHSSEWQKFLDQLGSTMLPDKKSAFEHYQSRTRQRIISKEESSKSFRECNANFALNWKNCAGVSYLSRDCEILKNTTHKTQNPENGEIMQYLYTYTNNNVHIFDLIGTRHASAPLRASYKQLKCIVDNDGDIVIDLERLFCSNICFFDPELYVDCPFNHEGDINIFGDETYQQRFEGFKEEIEKYPDFQLSKTFDSDILRSVDIIEHDKRANYQMNRMLRIVLSLLIVHRPKISQKIESVIESGKSRTNLTKPPLGVQMWGPKFEDMDAKKEDDFSILYSGEYFSTYQHVTNEDCPAYEDDSKRIHKKATKMGRDIILATLEVALKDVLVYRATTLIVMEN